MLMNYLIKKKLSVKFYDKMLINKKIKNLRSIKKLNLLIILNKYNVFLIMNNHPSNAELIYKIIDKKINSKILIFDSWSQINPKLLNNNISIVVLANIIIGKKVAIIASDNGIGHIKDQ